MGALKAGAPFPGGRARTGVGATSRAHLRAAGAQAQAQVQEQGQAQVQVQAQVLVPGWHSQAGGAPTGALQGLEGRQGGQGPAAHGHATAGSCPWKPEGGGQCWGGS